MTIKEIHNVTRQAWDKAAGKYHELFKNEMNEKPFDREVLDRFAAGLPENALICDAGCGPSAHIGRYLFDKGMNVFGIDISEKCIEIAKEYNPEMKFECTDFLDWQQEEDSLDAIISFYSVIYTPKKEINEVLDVFYRVIKPGGKLLIVVKKGDFEGFQESLLGIDVHPYFVEYTEEELESALKISSFNILELFTRRPYENEINNERIYCTAGKNC